MKTAAGLAVLIAAVFASTACRAQSTGSPPYSPQCENMRREHMALYQAEVNYESTGGPLSENVATARAFGPTAQTSSEADLKSILDSVRKQIEAARRLRAEATDVAAYEATLYNLQTLEIVQDYIADLLVRRSLGEDTSRLAQDYDRKLSDILTPIGRLAGQAPRARAERLQMEAQMRVINCPTMTAIAAPPPPPTYQEPSPAVVTFGITIAGRYATSLGPMTISSDAPSFSAVTLDGFVTVDGRIEGNLIVGTYSVRAAGLAPGAPYAVMDACPQANMGSRVWGTVSANLVKDAQGQVAGFEGVFDYCGVRGEGVTLQRFDGTRETTSVR